jgi:hypothetical protein
MSAETDLYPWRGRRITGHYWARNIFAVGEWAYNEAKLMRRDEPLLGDHPDDRETYGLDPELVVRHDALIDVGLWCQSWAEADPGDCGDPTLRGLSGFRKEWPRVYRQYRRLRYEETHGT